MKKPRLSILIAVTLLFAVFTLGFFLGRNGNHGSVELSVPAAMQTSPPQTTLPEPTTPETVAVTFPIDINRADASRFQIIDGKLMPSLCSIDGLGDKAAEAVVEAVKDGPFLSKDDFWQRTKVPKSVIDVMSDLGLLGDLPETNQLSLFD